MATTTPNPEFEAFDRAIGQLLSVSHGEMKKRIEAHKAEADKNPKKRGPKKMGMVVKPSSTKP